VKRVVRCAGAARTVSAGAQGSVYSSYLSVDPVRSIG
jgi:hypothetical protein